MEKESNLLYILPFEKKLAKGERKKNEKRKEKKSEVCIREKERLYPKKEKRLQTMHWCAAAEEAKWRKKKGKNRKESVRLGCEEGENLKWVWTRLNSAFLREL